MFNFFFLQNQKGSYDQYNYLSNILSVLFLLPKNSPSRPAVSPTPQIPSSVS